MAGLILNKAKTVKFVSTLGLGAIGLACFFSLGSLAVEAAPESGSGLITNHVSQHQTNTNGDNQAKIVNLMPVGNVNNQQTVTATNNQSNSQSANVVFAPVIARPTTAATATAAPTASVAAQTSATTQAKGPAESGTKTELPTPPFEEQSVTNPPESAVTTTALADDPAWIWPSVISLALLGIYLLQGNWDKLRQRLGIKQ